MEARGFVLFSKEYKKIRTLLLSRKGSDFHCLVRPGGFEPLAFRVGAERSIQLSYDRTIVLMNQYNIV